MPRAAHKVGMRQATKTAGLRIQQRFRFGILPLLVPGPVHPGVPLRDLVVPVKQQGWSSEELADAAFASLTPSRMIDVRVHVSKEPIFLRRLLLPGIDGLLIRESNIHDGFD